jgi:C-terminal region of aryl-sulfatase
MIAWGPGIKADSKNYEICGGLDFMATFAALGGTALPDKDREGKPTIFDSYDMSPLLFGTGPSRRKTWFYFTEDELSPGAIRFGQFKAVWNLRGDDGAQTGGLAVDTNLGWKGPEKYVGATPQLFDLWQDPQERYDILMNNYTEHSWAIVGVAPELQALMKSYVQYPPRKPQTNNYNGPLRLSNYQKYQWLRQELEKEGFQISIPTGN